MNPRSFITFLCLTIIIYHNQFNLYSQVPDSEKEALIALYDSTNGVNWINNTNWLSEQPVSTWYGITVSDDHVTTIFLENNNLNGTIPDELGNLAYLTTLYMNNNQLKGNIPATLGNLANLSFLYLYSNELEGSIPEVLGNLDSLTYLVISNNQLTDSIPASLGNLSKLKTINLSSNQLSGPIPTSFGGLSSLSQMYLAGNQLNGDIPTSLGNLSNLVTLSLDRNDLEGVIPSSLGNLSGLGYLALHSNQLTGEIPQELGNMSNLTFLSLSYNQLEGEIPEALGNILKLTRVFLSVNQLTGSIPDTIGSLIDLKVFEISYNQLTGSIPESLGKLSNLEVIDLSSNQLDGTIPVEIGEMDSLRSLFLHTNQLSGAVPGTIINCTKLSDLGIEKNYLDQLPDLSSLVYLDWLVIKNNQFTFEDIEPNIDVPNTSFIYSPQDSVGVKEDTTLKVGENLVLSVTVGGTANQYQWYKDNLILDGENASTYEILNAQESESGSYICEITNTIATDLTLVSRPFLVTVIDPTSLNRDRTPLPKEYALQQNYPNPFNPSTVINYQLPMTNDVKISIFNLSGQKVATLLSERKQAGYYQVEWNASGFASGLYYYRIEAGGFQDVKKMILIK